MSSEQDLKPEKPVGDPPLSMEASYQTITYPWYSAWDKWKGVDPSPFMEIKIDPLDIPQLSGEIGVKYDEGKPDYSLLPFTALQEMVKVLTYGAAKYSRDNWKHVTPFQERYIAATFRHLVAYSRGEQIDPESGLHHLAHAATCLYYIMERDLTKPI
jgi:hypothetical protein